MKVKFEVNVEQRDQVTYDERYGVFRVESGATDWRHDVPIVFEIGPYSRPKYSGYTDAEIMARTVKAFAGRLADVLAGGDGEG